MGLLDGLLDIIYDRKEEQEQRDETKPPNWWQSIIIGKKHEDAPDEVRASKSGGLVGVLEDLAAALGARSTNRRLFQEDRDRERATSLGEVWDQQDDLLEGYNARRRDEYDETGANFGDMMAGVLDDSNNENLDHDERERRMRQERIARGEEEQRERTEKMVGTIQTVSMLFGKLGTVVGGAIAGFAALRGAQETISKLAGWQMDRNLQYAEYSGQLASIEAENRANKIRRDKEMADEIGETAKGFSDSYNRFEDSLQPMRQTSMKAYNYFGGKILDVATSINNHVNDIGEFLGFWETEKGLDGFSFRAEAQQAHMNDLNMLQEGLFEKYRKNLQQRGVGPGSN